MAKYPEHKLVAAGRYARGMARHQLGKFAEAVAISRPCWPRPDATPAEKSDARYVLGLCQVGLKQAGRGGRHLPGRCLQEDPKYAAADKVLYELAWALKSRTRRPRRPRPSPSWPSSAPTAPAPAESQFHVGEAAYKAGNFQAAAAAYAAAMDKAGKTELGEKAAHKLGWAYYRLDNAGRGPAGVRLPAGTWPHGPLAADAAFMEAECLFKQKKYPEALAAYEQVKDPSSKDFQALTLLHTARPWADRRPSRAERTQNWQKSLDLLDQLRQGVPRLALPARGALRARLGPAEPRQARRGPGRVRQVLAKTNGEAAARAQFMIGEIQFQQKKHAEAVKSFFRSSTDTAIRSGRPTPPTRPPAASRSSRRRPRPSSSTRS